MGTASNATMGYALKLLGYRPRSIHELTVRLREKQHPDEAIRETIGKLEGWGYLNDDRFAEDWIRSRFINKPMGAQRLREELRGKGVSLDIIDIKLEEAFNIRSEFEIACDLASSKLRKSGDWRKVSGLLKRRGFSYDTIISVGNSLGVSLHC